MPKYKFSDAQKLEINEALKQSRNTLEYKRLQCLMLRAEKDMKLQEISEIVGYNYKSVGNIISKYFKEGLLGVLGENRKGGNKRNLTVEEEDAFIQRFLKKAEQDKHLIVAKIHLAYEELVGHTVPPSTIYRMLSRHDLKKIIAKKQKYSKVNPADQETYNINNKQNKAADKLN